MPKTAKSVKRPFEILSGHLRVIETQSLKWFVFASGVVYEARNPYQQKLCEAWDSVLDSFVWPLAHIVVIGSTKKLPAKGLLKPFRKV